MTALVKLPEPRRESVDEQLTHMPDAYAYKTAWMLGYLGGAVRSFITDPNDPIYRQGLVDASAMYETAFNEAVVR